MPSEKYKYYSFIAEKTIEDLISKRGYWYRFLETSARLYKYPFPDQLLIFAQRPDTIACASIEVWNDTFGRWVMRGSKGIALQDNTWSTPRLKYVFDVADTEPLRLNARPVKLWEMLPEHREPVLIELAKSYEGVTDTLADTFHNIARELAVEYYDDNAHDIKYRAEESFLGQIPVYDFSDTPIEEGDDSHLRAAFVNALSRSIEYSLMSRCGLDTSESFDEDDFENIYQFNVPDMMYALGTAVSELSEQVLRDIETVIKKYERMHTAERSVQDYDRNPYLHDARRLSAPEHHPEGSTAGVDGNSGQIREDADELSERTQDNQLQPPAADREIIPAPAGSGRSSDEADGTNDERVDNKEQATEQSDRPDGMDSSDERIEIASGRDSPPRTGLQLDPTISQVGKSSIEELLSTSPITLDEVDTILRDGSNEKHSHLRIAAHFVKAPNNNSEFMRYEYLHGRFYRTPTETGKGYIFGTKKVAAWYSEEGILLNIGDSARYTRSSIMIPWEQAAERVHELMISGQYVSGDVLDEALENERFELAYKINNFYNDGVDNYPEEWKADKGGRPDEVAVIQDLLRDTDNHQAILDRLEIDSLVWYNSPDRRAWVDPERALILMHEIMNPPVLSAIYGIQNQKEFKRFITDDEINSFLIPNSIRNEQRYRTLSFFLRNNDSKDRMEFIKNYYGHSGGTWSQGDGWYGATPGGGLEFKRGDIMNPGAKTKLNWNNVTKRVDTLIKEGHFIKSNEFDNLKQYELLELARYIKNFHSGLPDDYERPFSDDINFSYPGKEEYDAIHELLDDAELVDDLYNQMYHIFENTSENDRYYNIRKAGYERLTMYRDGTYTLFPDIDAIFDKSERNVSRENAIVLNEQQSPVSMPDNEQLSFFGIFEPLPTVDQQIERIDRTLYEEAQQIKQEAEVEKAPALSLPKGLDALLLGASNENKEKIAEQFAINSRSREAVSLIKDIYGEFNGVSIKETIGRISELIEDGIYLPVPELSENHEVEIVDEVSTSITNPAITASVNDDFSDTKPSIPSMTVPPPVFFVDWNKAQYDFNLNQYYDRDIIGYDKDGVRYGIGRSGGITYVTTTGFLYGGNEVPKDIYEQIQEYGEGKLSDEEVKINYLSVLEVFINNRAADLNRNDYDVLIDVLSNSLFAGDSKDNVLTMFSQNRTNYSITTNLENSFDVSGSLILSTGEATNFTASRRGIAIHVISKDRDQLMSYPWNEITTVLRALMPQWIIERSEELEAEATSEEIYTEITDPELIAQVNEIFGDNKPETILNVEDQIRDVLASRGYVVSDELIDEGITEFIAQGNIGNIEEISNFIEGEFLSEEPVPEIAAMQPDISLVPAHNFRITDVNLGEGSAKAKFRSNINALQTLIIIENEKRNATPEEQEILSRYVGWGGIPEAFDNENSQWTKEYTELNKLLASDEWESARASTLNAHYTPPIVIRAMYETIERLGFKTGNMLEPACAVGNFFGLLPDSMSNSKIYGVEIDGISARIAKQLYPNTTIQHTAFERADFPDAFFDIAIGNVPFGQYGVVDSRYDKHKFSLHNYFFAKTIDKVRPGGIIAFITSKFTMDEKNPKVRRYIAERAELLGAVRLPNNAFLKNAGTETTMDILILQKRDRPLDIEPEWVHLGLTDDGIPVNRYFIDNPEMLLGRMALDERMNSRYGTNTATACLPFDNADLADQLDVALSFIDGQITVEELDDLDGIDNHAIPADPHVKNFSYALVQSPVTENTGSLFGNINDSKVYFRENSLMYPVDLPATTLERIKGMIALRDCVQKLISLQVDEHTDDEIKMQQRELNSLYDRFTSDFGLINSSANNKAFNADSSYYLLCSLEILNQEGELDRKADMFSKRTIKQKNIITRVDTASEALAVSIAEKACVDLDYMLEISKTSREKLISDLEGVIFLNIGNAGLQHETYVTADEYLSGNVRNKLELAKAAAEVNPALEINVKALEAIQPKDLEASEITVRLGATWIEPEYINEFMYDLLDVSWRMKDVYKVNYHPLTDSWQVTNKGRALYSDINATVTYGTERANAYEIIDDCLNLRDIRVYDYNKDADGKTVRILNKKETTLAQQKQELIKQKFQDWIWKDPERRHTLVKFYNDRFNSNRPREYDGSHIQFIGANPDIAFHPHQINAVARQILGGNTLLAHVVGAGKTFEMAGAAMESKRLGLCHKTLFAVPNHLTEQWGTEFLRLYPNANILVARKKDFEMRNRKKFCAKIATGDYDAVIIGHSQLEKIPLSRERQERLLNEQIWEIQSGIEEMKALSGERWSIKQLERTKKQLEVRLAKLLDSKKRDDVVTFEQLGVDRLFVDEAHNFKNLFMFTKMRNVAGLSTSEAQKSSDLFMKCRYMDELTDNKGVIFATGTPISNSITEMYTMQRYLQYDKLQEKGLTHFDCWASIFGETQTSIELAPEGTGYRARTRFAKFHNLPELMSMFKEVADIQTADMINLPVPQAKFDTIIVEPSDLQKEMVQELSERAAAVQARLVDPSTDNMLKITTDGRKIGLDQRLINPLLPDYEGSKVNACTDNVFNIWSATSKDRLTQLVFCDFSTPNKDGRFNVYDDMRAKLIERGIPESEVAFIHNADSDTKKKDLFAKVRQGKVRVLFGSTFKMGSGTNVQDKLIAIHDADCPWRPADLEQRAGRIIRQGNQNPEVLIFRYATNGTFDSYLWQTVQKKQEFIAQIMTSKSPVRSCEDVDETALSYAEIKALCAGNPLIAEKMNLDIEITKLRMLKSEHQSQRHRLEDDLIANFPRKVAAVSERIKGIEKDAMFYSEEKAKYIDVKIVSGTAAVSPKFPGMVINGVSYKEKEPAAKALLDACKGLKGRDEKDIGKYMGFEMSIKFSDTQVKLLLRRTMTYQIDLGTDTFGNITRINNALDSLPDRLDGAKDELANIQRQQEAAKLELEKPFALSGELEEKEARLAMLNAELNIEGEGYFDIVDNNGERSSDEEEPDTENIDEPEPDDEVEYEYSYSQVPQLVTAKTSKPSILEGIRDFDNSKNQNVPNKDKLMGRGI